MVTLPCPEVGYSCSSSKDTPCTGALLFFIGISLYGETDAIKIFIRKFVTLSQTLLKSSISFLTYIFN